MNGLYHLLLVLRKIVAEHNTHVHLIKYKPSGALKALIAAPHYAHYSCVHEVKHAQMSYSTVSYYRKNIWCMTAAYIHAMSGLILYLIAVGTRLPIILSFIQGFNMMFSKSGKPLK